MSEGMVDGYPRQVWWNADGETIVESYTITDMAHGTPLGIAGNDERYGAQGAFLIEAGISSSYHIASFFGLTDWILEPKSAAKPATSAPAKELAEQAAKEAAKEAVQQPAKELATIAPVASAAMSSAPDLSRVLWPLATLNHPSKPPRQQRRGPVDVSDVITRALTAAGLMK
jgi:hypothetical protein